MADWEWLLDEGTQMTWEPSLHPKEVAEVGKKGCGTDT
jgi:hypothetical protein